MPGAPIATNDLITGGISFLLTLMVLSYLVGDNPVFRVAVYIFVGASAGYVAAVVWHQVLFPHLVIPLATGSVGSRLLALVPLLLGVLLLFKIFPKTSRLGTPAMAFLVGVGAAVAISGAVLGTLLPQTLASIQTLDLPAVSQFRIERLTEGAVMLVGTLATLAYFHFGARATPAGPQRGKFVSALAWLGRIFIAITFGVLFAGVFVAAMTAFIERLHFIISYLSTLFAGSLP